MLGPSVAVLDWIQVWLFHNVRNWKQVLYIPNLRFLVLSNISLKLGSW